MLLIYVIYVYLSIRILGKYILCVRLRGSWILIMNKSDFCEVLHLEKHYAEE